jgi:hypothetical protein
MLPRRDSGASFVLPDSEEQELIELPHEQLDVYRVLEEAYRSALGLRVVLLARL